MLVNGSLAANASCTISLDLQVTATAPGVLNSPAVTLSSNQAPNATAAAINLTVTVPAPNFTMAFVPNPRTVAAGNPANATLTFTITNNASIPLTNLAFNHILPAGVPAGAPALQVVAGAAFTPSCGAAALTTGVATIQFAGGQVNPGQTCVVTIPVQTAANLAAGNNFAYPNAPVTLFSTQAAPVTAGPVTWTAQGT